MIAELLPPMDIGKMNLNDRNGNRRNRVAVFGSLIKIQLFHSLLHLFTVCLLLLLQLLHVVHRQILRRNRLFFLFLNVLHSFFILFVVAGHACEQHFFRFHHAFRYNVV